MRLRFVFPRRWAGQEEVELAPSDPRSVDKARRRFYELQKMGWMAVRLQGDRGVMTWDFDAEVDYLMIPPVAGG